MSGRTYCSPRLRRPWAAAKPGRTLQQDTKPLLPGGRQWNRRDCWAWPQRPWAAAGPGRSARGRRQGLAGLRDDAPIPCCLEGAGGTSWTTSPSRSARGRRQGLAGLRDRSLRSPAVWRAPVEPEGLLAPAAAPVGGGRAWPGFEIDHSEPLGSRVAISRAGRRPQASTTRQSVRAWRPRS